MSIVIKAKLPDIYADEEDLAHMTDDQIIDLIKEDMDPLLEVAKWEVHRWNHLR